MAVLLLILALLPFFTRALLELETSSSDVHPWFPDDSADQDSFVILERLFGPEDYWLLCYEESEGSEATQILAEALERSDLELEHRLLDRVTIGEALLESLPEGDREVLFEALRGLYFDREGMRSSVLLQSSEYGFRNRRLVFDLISDVDSELSLDAGELRITGSGYLGVMADDETKQTLLMVTPVTFVLSSLLAFFLIRTLKLAAIVMITGALASTGSIAVIHFAGQSLSHLLVVVPSLALLLALSNSIHLIQYYQEAVESEDPQPWRNALGCGWGPTVAASVTTVIGFLSLQLSSMPVVRSFSTFGAAGVVVAMISVLLVVPAGLILFRPGVRGAGSIETWLSKRVDPWVFRSRTAFICFGLILMLASIFGVKVLKAEVRMETFFSETSPFSRNFEWFKAEFGPLQSCQVLGVFNDSVSFSDQFEAVIDLHEAIRSGSEKKTVFSAAVFSEEFARISQFGEPAIAEFERQMEEQRLFADENQVRYWRITVYHEPFPDVSSSPVNQEIRESIDGLEGGGTRDRGRWTITGAHQLFGSAQETLMKELLKTFLCAFIVITPCVMVFLRSFRLGLVALIGNVFPVLVLFGCMGLLGGRIDIATMVIASIAFGIAVDDTMHFLTCLARGLRCPTSAEESGISMAVTSAYRKSGSAILKTTIVISVGMMAFILSDFDPSRRFALYTSLVLFLAVIGDLILIPALVRGPFARMFRKM
ncbi:MAG: MMPL family transporter [Verrucomicrobiota bacterium]